jgi:hypothetical protein
MNLLKVTILKSSLFVFSAISMAQGNPHEGHEIRQHGIHVHGTASMSIVSEEQQLLLELDSPGMNIVGFEHAPNTAEQESALNSAMALLNDPATVAHFRGGECVLDSYVLAASGADKHSGHKHADDSSNDVHGNKADHSEIHARYVFRCARTDALESIHIGLFEKFPGIEAISVQWIINSRQGSQVLTRAKPVISVR